MRTILFITILLMLSSCFDSRQDDARRFVSDWYGRVIEFPKDTSFVSYSRRWGTKRMSLNYSDYAIFCFADSTGCMGCKMQLSEWKRFIREVDSISNGQIPFLFVLQSSKKEDVAHFLKKNMFDYPVFIDVKDEFNQLNSFSTDIMLQSFLLDKNRKVLIVGNPIYNPKIRELYVKTICGEDITSLIYPKVLTKVSIDNPNLSLGRFDGREEQKGEVILTNVGDEPLTITDAIPTCDCTSISFPKHPIAPGEQALLSVTYKAEHPGIFEETVTVYGNIKGNTVKFKVSGEAE